MRDILDLLTGAIPPGKMAWRQVSPHRDAWYQVQDPMPDAPEILTRAEALERYPGAALLGYGGKQARQTGNA